MGHDPSMPGKPAVATRIHIILSRLERAGRGPDKWQSMYLSRAIDYAASGKYLEADTDVALAEVAEVARPLKRVTDLPDDKPVTVEDLRSKLNQLCSS